eukprot:1155615-Pelagomonas_calceolata.AAC.2
MHESTKPYCMPAHAQNKLPRPEHQRHPQLFKPVGPVVQKQVCAGRLKIGAWTWVHRTLGAQACKQKFGTGNSIPSHLLRLKTATKKNPTLFHSSGVLTTDHAAFLKMRLNTVATLEPLQESIFIFSHPLGPGRVDGPCSHSSQTRGVQRQMKGTRELAAAAAQCQEGDGGV